MARPAAMFKLFLSFPVRQVIYEHQQRTCAVAMGEFRAVMKEMAGAAGFEPATYGFGDRRSTN